MHIFMPITAVHKLTVATENKRSVCGMLQLDLSVARAMRPNRLIRTKLCIIVPFILWLWSTL